MFDYGARLLSSQQYGITKYCRPEVRRSVQPLLNEEGYDVILCDFMAAGVIPWGFPTPKVLFTHNVEAPIWRRHYEVATNPVWKAISRREWRKMEAVELQYLQLADHVLAVSETDRDAFSHFLDPAKITVIPTGGGRGVFPVHACRRDFEFPGVHWFDGLASERRCDPVGHRGAQYPQSR
jgi:hypothetical protein